MALHSVAKAAPIEAESTSSRNLHEPLIIAGSDFCLNLGVIDGCEDAESFRATAAHLTGIANSVLHLATVRGNNESDPPSTLIDAATGAQILLQLSSAMYEAAATHEARHGVQHGC